MPRRSLTLAQQAFDRTEQIQGAALQKEVRSRARELPTSLQRNGLIATAAVLDGRASKPAYAAVRNALRDHLFPGRGPNDLLSVAIHTSINAQDAGANGTAYAELSRRARDYSWWLKRAAEARWS
jgi:CRISPR/Cas system CMR-associated protein Cmr5 small subunit